MYKYAEKIRCQIKLELAALLDSRTHNSYLFWKKLHHPFNWQLPLCPGRNTCSLLIVSFCLTESQRNYLQREAYSIIYELLSGMETGLLYDWGDGKLSIQYPVASVKENQIYFWQYIRPINDGGFYTKIMLCISHFLL